MEKGTEEIRWSEALPLDAAGIESAPNGPGLIQLLHGHPGRLAWVEEALNVRERLSQMASPGWRPPREMARAKADAVRFRAAHVPDAAQRARTLAAIRTELGRDGGRGARP